MVPRGRSQCGDLLLVAISTLAARSDSDGGCCWFPSVVSVANRQPVRRAPQPDDVIP